MRQNREICFDKTSRSKAQCALLRCVLLHKFAVHQRKITEQIYGAVIAQQTGTSDCLFKLTLNKPQLNLPQKLIIIRIKPKSESVMHYRDIVSRVAEIAAHAVGYEFIHLFRHMRRTNYGYIVTCHKIAALGIAEMNLTILGKCLKCNRGNISGNCLNIVRCGIVLFEKITAVRLIVVLMQLTYIFRMVIKGEDFSPYSKRTNRYIRHLK